MDVSAGPLRSSHDASSASSVLSADGTVIAWHRTGHGPDVVLLHGTSADAASWAPVAGRLEADVTLHAVDRRGRGRSGLGEPYAFDREVEDVAAVVASLGGPPYLVGHSHGAVVAAAAAARGVAVRGLVLFEPPVAAADHIDVPTLAAACEARLAAGDREGCLRAFYAAIGEERMVDLMRGVPGLLERFLANAPTIPRELAASAAFSADLLAGVTVPTLLLAGQRSPAVFQDSVRRVAGTVSASTTVTLSGQSHLAHVTDPAAFAGAVLAFVRDLASPAGRRRPRIGR